MKYISTRSTRSKAKPLSFRQTILSGLAKDGGLYMPEHFPQFSKQTIKNMQNKNYNEIALQVIKPFIGNEMKTSELKKIIDNTCKMFSDKEITPLVKIDNHYILELFHGPTLAFKDLAMQLLARLVDSILQQSGQQVNIVGATSGDTGGAAVYAFGGKKNCKLFILYPKGKISKVQEKQMTNCPYTNVFPLAVDGNFDDCQRLVKQMFNEQTFRQKYNLLAINSINWGRIMAQIVYYFYAASRINSKISFCVPTGNFGDIFAGYCAKKMGLDIEKLIIATNSNDILYRAWKNGLYKQNKTKPTISPSMDIQISSNFERLLFEASNRDINYINEIMQMLEIKKQFTIKPNVLRVIKQHFIAGRASEAQTKSIIKKYAKKHNYLPDPHTAVGLHVANNVSIKNPCVILATAHAAKFPQAVKQASGIKPTLPKHIKDKFTNNSRSKNFKNNINKIKQFIENNARNN